MLKISAFSLRIAFWGNARNFCLRPFLLNLGVKRNLPEPTGDNSWQKGEHSRPTGEHSRPTGEHSRPQRRRFFTLHFFTPTAHQRLHMKLTLLSFREKKKHVAYLVCLQDPNSVQLGPHVRFRNTCDVHFGHCPNRSACALNQHVSLSNRLSFVTCSLKS